MIPLAGAFTTCDWSTVPPERRPGEHGEAEWKTQQYGDVRVREVRYSAGYRADHWCERGHVLLVLEGTLLTELADGSEVTLTPGTSYAVPDGAMPHRSRTETGARLFIVD
jgi:mannose-6-phosphate isomerase-like protein (cupin superfamily)